MYKRQVHHLRQTALIKRIAALITQYLKRISEIRIAEDFTGLGCFSLGKPERRRIVELFDKRLLLPKGIQITFKVIRNHGCNREPLAGITNGWREHIRHGQLPKARMRGEPAVHSTRHRDGQ